MQRTMVLLVVGLAGRHLGKNTPRLSALAERGKAVPLSTITPAVTCAVQSTFVTGTLPSEHGCVANGWYFRDLAQVWLWRQSNALVQGDKVWDVAKRRDDRFTCAKMFWWYNMHSTANWSVTPRPIYRADGRKLPDVYADPPGLRDTLSDKLGTFPLFNFWGPKADIRSSRWIADSARWVYEERSPTLTLVYLPHLDYDLQKYGPEHPKVDRALRDIDDVAGELIDRAQRDGTRVIVLSEYGITPVTDAVHINRALRSAGFIAFREELGEEHFYPGASEAFAVADHQIAHIYVRKPGRVEEVKRLVEALDGVDYVLDASTKAEHGLDHARAGELVAVSKADRWFSYYWWLDDRKAPDYARTVNIHAKPGYDPAELFIDPDITLAPAYIASWLVRSKVLNQRALLDVIPLDASLVRGSHGRPTDDPQDGPVFITSDPELVPQDTVAATDVHDLMLKHLFD
ncbi:MAG: nucleotide pyrophosphatase/phosphodiesterase family protein [Myxococcota bacterium]